MDERLLSPARVCTVIHLTLELASLTGSLRTQELQELDSSDESEDDRRDVQRLCTFVVAPMFRALNCLTGWVSMMWSLAYCLHARKEDLTEFFRILQRPSYARYKTNLTFPTLGCNITNATI
eukprot:4206556-Amphidinium_carterae.1